MIKNSSFNLGEYILQIQSGKRCSECFYLHIVKFHQNIPFLDLTT